MKKNILILVFICSLSAFHACKKDVCDPTPPANEGEVITTLRLVFVDSANSNDVRTAEFRDPDGPGGVPYDRFDTLLLSSNSTYYGQLLLLNETVSPADTISNEVLEEGADHLLCYASDIAGTTIERTDFDSNGLPLGLQTIWRTSAPGNGSVSVILKHQPGIKTGDCSTGETDVEVNFPMEVR